VAFVSVKQSAHLRATVLAVKSAGREVRADVRKQTRSVAATQWKSAMAKQSRSVQQTRMLVDTARITVSDQSVRVRSAGSKRRALSGGATPVEQGKAFEFGSNKAHGRQLPKARRRGYVFYPALADMAPRILALWTQTAMRVVYKSLEGKRS
jgi:hypothetical protein